jgi:hypothetical protein
MSLSLGIIGLPNVGKSTLFQAITKKQVPKENYPFCTIDPNIGTVAVPDSRIDALAEITHSQRKIYPLVKFVDIAGLVKGANQGEGLGNKFLAEIRNVDAILYVLRCFKNKNIINTQTTINVLQEKNILETEMMLKDIETLEKRLVKIKKEKRIKSSEKKVSKELEILEKAINLLNSEQNLINQEWNQEEKTILENYQLLTMKKRLFLFNGSANEISPQTIKAFQKNNWSFLIINALAELSSSDLTPQERLSLGLPAESELSALIKKSYQLLDLITFFTTGADETKGWNLPKNSSAPQAGGVIHSDFEKRFIKAEVISWKDLVKCGGMIQAREKGLIRTEGKEYKVQDGDVIEIKSDA